MRFVESSHKYFNKNNEPYKGVTSFLGTFEPESDWSQIRKNYLKKHNTQKKLLTDICKKWGIDYYIALRKWGNEEYNEDFVKRLWKDAGNRSLIGGNFYHNFQEMRLGKEENFIYNPVVEDKKDFIDLLNLKDGFTYLELGVYSHRHSLAGQIDKVKIENGKSIISDYKTNKKRPSFEPEKFWDASLGYRKEKRFKTPISHLPVTKGYIYALQLSMYAYVLELYGIPNESLTIEYVHTEYININDPTDSLIISEERDLERKRVVTDLEFIDVPYLKEEVKALLAYSK